VSTGSSRALTVTAQYTAAARARESDRADALFSDPLAALLAGEEGFAWLTRLGPSATLWPVIRTRFLDDLLRDVPLKQVVLVAAGFDTRAYRLPWAEGTCLYEIDQPDVMQHKDSVLTEAGLVPQCRRTVLSADLRQSWAELLVAAGFRADQPAVWIVEGLLMYLDRAAAQHVMEAVSQLACSGSCLGLDLPECSLGGHEIADPEQWLRSLGWQAVVRELPEVAASYGRPPHRPYAPSGRARVFLIAARKG
jgi:methyltransferase (TIGR00027 family)